MRVSVRANSLSLIPNSKFIRLTSKSCVELSAVPRMVVQKNIFLRGTPLEVTVVKRHASERGERSQQSDAAEKL